MLQEQADLALIVVVTHWTPGGTESLPCVKASLFSRVITVTEES